MDKEIKNGDIVMAIWADDSSLMVKVLNIPRGSGDLLQVEEIDSGKVRAINANCPDFRQLVKETNDK